VRHLAAPELVGQLLLDHVAEGALGIGADAVQRHRVQLVQRQLDAAEDEADLRAVAVGQDEVPAERQQLGHVLAGLPGDLELVVDPLVLLVADQRVAADGQDREPLGAVRRHFSPRTARRKP